jgi:hypothetical protein
MFAGAYGCGVLPSLITLQPSKLEAVSSFMFYSLVFSHVISTLIFTRTLKVPSNAALQ